MNINEESLKLHRELKGKIAIKNKKDIKNMHDLSLVYTPGVASACMQIHADNSEAYNLTGKGNTVAVISDGTAVLGLGNIGPLAAMPVMEGKCAIFKKFANIDAIPLVLNTSDVDELVNIIYALSPSFGGINLEDISAPRCFEVERRLNELCDIPVFHDDQHGTAIVTGAALLNALKLVNKKLKDVRIVVNGAGSAGIAITKFLLNLGAKDILVCDRNGLLVATDKSLNETHSAIAKITNKRKISGSLSVALTGADVFIGVSAPNIVISEMISKMKSDAIVFPLANPVPEISREAALKGGARIVGTGLSNFPNQINNALVFPGLFRGALDCGARKISVNMQIAAAKGLAAIVRKNELHEDYIIPNIFNKRVAKMVSRAVIKAYQNETQV